MPRFSKYFRLGLSQHQLDFVDIDTDHDTPVYVDPFAIEIRNDILAAEASQQIRVFFKKVLDAIRDCDSERGRGLMPHLTEPREMYLGVSRGDPQGRGVGRKQAAQLIRAITNSRAYKSGAYKMPSPISSSEIGRVKDGGSMVDAAGNRKCGARTCK